jgi:hypothetical protein
MSNSTIAIYFFSVGLNQIPFGLPFLSPSKLKKTTSQHSYFRRLNNRRITRKSRKDFGEIPRAAGIIQPAVGFLHRTLADRHIREHSHDITNSIF